MKLASLNGKNNIDVIVNQFFRQLPKRWMLLQQEREDCRLARKNLIFHILHIIDFQNQSKCTSKCIENARVTSKPGWGHLNKQNKTKKSSGYQPVLSVANYVELLPSGRTNSTVLYLSLMLKKYGYDAVHAPFRRTGLLCKTQGESTT